MSTELNYSQRLHRAVIAAAERCHRDIAESVHGTLRQTLGGAGIMAQVLSAGVKAGQPVDSSRLDSLADTLDLALDEARQVLTQLQPVAPGAGRLSDGPCPPAAETSAGKTTCAFECENTVFIDKPDAALSFYRVVEEAVRTAVEIAQARDVKIMLIEQGEMIALNGLSRHSCVLATATAT